MRPGGAAQSVDPWGQRPVFSTYAYAENRVMIGIDPFGLFVIDPSCDCVPPKERFVNVP